MILKKLAMAAPAALALALFCARPAFADADVYSQEEAAAYAADENVSDAKEEQAPPADAEAEPEKADDLDDASDAGDDGQKNEPSKAKGGKSQKSNKKSQKAVKGSASLRLMSSIINCEAGGEPFQGKIAVGIVIMNRVKSDRYPDTIKKVLYQRGQFSPVRNGMLKKKLAEYDAGKTRSRQWKSCMKAARKVLSGQRAITYRGKTKNMRGFYFFSVTLRGAKFRLGGHKFK